MKNRFISVLLSVALGLLVVGVSIGVPIVCRPFYYAHIDALDLPGATGWDRETIRGAYDGVMDYMFRGSEFSTGALRWSESGKSHFADVKVLFHLDLWVAGLSAAAVAVLLALSRRVRPHRFLGRGPSFWAGLGLLAVFAVILVLGASDFDRAFVVFHSIFFPGKTNWIFDAATDQVILILPEVYFRNCAILALVILFVLVAVCLVLGRKKRAKNVRETAKTAP